MADYGFMVFEDQTGNVVEQVEGYTFAETAEKGAIDRMGYWEEEVPRGAYSYVVYNEATGEELAEGRT